MLLLFGCVTVLLFIRGSISLQVWDFLFFILFFWTYFVRNFVSVVLLLLSHVACESRYFCAISRCIKFVCSSAFCSLCDHIHDQT